MNIIRDNFFFAIILLLFTLSTNIFSQVQEKPSFDIEEEFIEDFGSEEQPTSEEKELETKKERSIIIQGEDELWVKSRRQSTSLIEPTSEKNTQWNFYEKEKKPQDDPAQVKRSERIASIELGYGLYNNLSMDASIHTGTKYSAHSIIYHRKQKDAEGRNLLGIDNSSSSIDQIVSSNTFKISDSHRMFLKGYFLLKNQGLQVNQNFSEQAQRGFFTEFSNLFAYAEQKLNIVAQFQKTDSEAHRLLSQGKDSEEGTFTSGNLKASWDYFFGERNSLGLDASLFYADNQLYGNQKKIYFQGFVGGWLLIPIYSAFVGKLAIPWDIHVRLAFDLFISEQGSPIPIPSFVLESHFDFWLFHLLLYRETKTPDINESYLEKKFFKPIHFDIPQDRWSAEIENLFDISREVRFSLNGGFHFYNQYYFPKLDNDELYQYSSQKLRLVYGFFSLENKPFSFFSYSLGLRYEYFIDQVQFRPPVSFVSEGKFKWKKFNLLLELEFSDIRNAPNQVLSLYFLIDIDFSFQLDNIVDFYVTFNNILDQQYVVLPPYQTSGFTFVAGARVQIY